MQANVLARFQSYFNLDVKQVALLTNHSDWQWQLLDKGMVTTQEYANFCQQHLLVPWLDLKGNEVVNAQLFDENAKTFTELSVLPINQNKGTTVLVSTDLNYEKLENRLEFVLGEAVSLWVCDPVVFKSIKDNHESQDHHWGDSDLKAASDIESIIEQTITSLITKGGSDIHLESNRTGLLIRLRIDGVLHRFQQIGKAIAKKLISRIKVLSKLDITEQRKPLDGRLLITIAKGGKVQFRVSTIPTLYGEKLVLRIVEQPIAELSLPKLGLTQHQLTTFLRYLDKPQGLILVTGPTGSGKSATLYSALKYKNSDSINISTVEDPIEHAIEGINQVQINPQVELSFASALRALLRQDPDSIMVGEIRDGETAEIAVKAAQTGHLVLSTLHSNSAIAARQRLVNLGVSESNLADGLSLVIAQRLIRKLCELCKTPQTSTYTSAPVAVQSQSIDVNTDNEERLYQATGCQYCHQGYHGRIAIFDLLTQPACIAAGRIEESENHDGLRLQALALLKQGVTDINEINRVCPE